MSALRDYVAGVLHPARAHVTPSTAPRPYFEGWYYKMVDAALRQRLAVIPGLFIGEDPARDHAFVQVLDGTNGHATYHVYPPQAFTAAPDAFEVCVGPNRFDGHGFTLAIDDEQRSAHGTLRFTGQKPWPVTWHTPGVMGPFGWLPAMECYHGVLSFDHGVDGALSIDGAPWDFAGGRGYIEKDWGKGFPRGYVWMQSNHFPTLTTSLETAVAIVPTYGIGAFRGFQAGLWHANRLYAFTTYNGASLDALSITDEVVTIVYRRGPHTLHIRAERAEGTLLHAPVRTEMHRRVNETLKAALHVHLTQQVGTSTHTILNATGTCAGLEVHGDLDALLGMR